MHKKIIKSLLLVFFSALTACMLLHSRQSLDLALEGLNLWFSKMIPALLPFMILSGLLIAAGLSDSFASWFSPLLRPLYGLSDSCLYCIIIGFLCGFPMGARVCAQSYERKKISRREAMLLLSFCNNIGPVYFTGYVLQLFPVQKTWIVFAGMYGIPLLYGLFLRYTLFRDIPSVSRLCGGQKKRRGKMALKAASYETDSSASSLSFSSLLIELHASILSSLDAITVLGGYMIFCNLLNLIPQLFFQHFPRISVLLGPLFEITSGLSRLGDSCKSWAFIALCFGGISCIAQTYSCIRNTDLSLKEYIFHKLIQTMLEAAFYAVFPII